MATPAYGAQSGTVAEPNNAALYESRRRQTITGSQVVDNIVSFSNCTCGSCPALFRVPTPERAVSLVIGGQTRARADEVVK